MPKIRHLTQEEKISLDIPDNYEIQENYIPDIGKTYYSVRNTELQIAMTCQVTYQ